MQTLFPPPAPVEYPAPGKSGLEVEDLIVEEACGVDDFVEVDDGLEAEDRDVEDFDDDEDE